MDINGELPCQAIGHEIDEEFLTSSHKNIGGIKMLFQNSPYFRALHRGTYMHDEYIYI
jgi:hypothetical protein